LETAAVDVPNIVCDVDRQTAESNGWGLWRRRGERLRDVFGWVQRAGLAAQLYKVSKLPNGGIPILARWLTCSFQTTTEYNHKTVTEYKPKSKTITDYKYKTITDYKYKTAYVTKPVYSTSTRPPTSPSPACRDNRTRHDF